VLNSILSEFARLAGEQLQGVSGHTIVAFVDSFRHGNNAIGAVSNPVIRSLDEWLLEESSSTGGAHLWLCHVSAAKLSELSAKLDSHDTQLPLTCIMVFEDQRFIHEDLERLEQAIADRAAEEPRNVSYSPVRRQWSGSNSSSYRSESVFPATMKSPSS
jgi:hypothetical protein